MEEWGTFERRERSVAKTKVDLHRVRRLFLPGSIACTLLTIDYYHRQCVERSCRCLKDRQLFAKFAKFLFRLFAIFATLQVLRNRSLSAHAALSISRVRRLSPLNSISFWTRTSRLSLRSPVASELLDLTRARWQWISSFVMLVSTGSASWIALFLLFTTLLLFSTFSS